MNLIVIEKDEINDGNVTLSDHRCTHIRKVLRSKEGDCIKIGVLNGSVGSGRIIQLTLKKVVVALTLDALPPPPSCIDLVLALPRPIMLKRILSQATQMGVKNIYLINANRVEKSFFSSSLLQEDAIRTILIQGLEQSVDTILPKVNIHSRFKPFVEDILPTIISSGNITGVVAHPAAPQSLYELETLSPPKRIMVAVGPEGGWVDFEIDRFMEQGFQPFSLGPRILRVDTAIPALLGQLALTAREI